ncbi:inorganic diphosphatase, partial [Candidatus Bathyarchaeota archaeon]|nr:inorganic diphosphatase [Candidatus Bathyarchaeota archaeon]
MPAGDQPPTLLNMVIEVMAGSRAKYEYCSEWEVFVLDRVIPSSVVFPVEYGFVPQTWGEDNDPLDIMVLSYEPLEVGCVVKVRVVGVLIVEDEKGEDAKVLPVPVHAARFDGYQNITDVHPHRLREIQ